jgi:hypothetical protein
VFKQFAERVLDVVLLLIGLFIFNSILYALLPFFDFGEWSLSIVRNSYWIGQLIFGIIIFRLTDQNNKVAMPIGVLATVLPVFGGLFYLLTTMIIAHDNERQNIRTDY